MISQKSVSVEDKGVPQRTHPCPVVLWESLLGSGNDDNANEAKNIVY